jgi:hypothetical protein
MRHVTFVNRRVIDHGSLTVPHTAGCGIGLWMEIRLDVDAEVIDRALPSAFRDFEDAVQMAAAVAAGADYVATRDVKDFSAGPVPAVTPAELLPLLRPSV